MKAPPQCPRCGSTDVMMTSRPKLVPGKAEHLTETAYLCDLGHMFALNEQSETEGAVSSSTGEVEISDNRRQ